MNVGRIVGLSIILSSALAMADVPPSAPPAPEETYRWQLGQKALDLGHDVQLQLPAGYVFLGMPDADRFLKKNGSFDNEGVLGVVMSQDEKQSWGVILDYQEAGYVKDDEKLDGDELLKAIRQGTEEGNKERIAHGFPALSVGEWTEVPHYDRATHRLVGGGIVGTGAGDLVSELALAVEMGADATDIGRTIHPHPTLGESVGLAAEFYEGVCTELLPKKRR